jgi:3-methyladenine DNA glycosylase AlkD
MQTTDKAPTIGARGRPDQFAEAGALAFRDMMDPAGELFEAVREGLRAVADPAKAPQMQAYMKSAMPYYGVNTPGQRSVFRAVFAVHPLADRSTWLRAVELMWRTATYREERYAAIALTGYPAYAHHQDADLVNTLYAELVSTGGWWDYVDEIAIRRIGPILRREPGRVEPIMRAWATDRDRWKRRAAIICQVGSKDSTERGLLAYAIDANRGDKDFFIRKGIGWALREHAKRDPEWVRSFVAERSDVLSALSVREALKNIGPSRQTR